MIIGLWHPGSGLGDQIFAYLAARTRAEALNVDFAMIGDFKGSFIKLDKGLYADLLYNIQSPSGKIIIPEYPIFEPKGNSYDPEFNFIPNNTIIDGTCMQDEKYWDIEKVRQWLITDPLEMPDEKCIINFRGGEFSMFPELFLTKEYWEKGITLMKGKYPNIKFEIHTDDEALAANFFKDLLVDFRVIKGIENNWKAVRYAKHLILSNSAFGIIPALLNENVKEVIAPRFWARRNIGQWSMPSNYYKKFQYI